LYIKSVPARLIISSDSRFKVSDVIIAWQTFAVVQLTKTFFGMELPTVDAHDGAAGHRPVVVRDVLPAHIHQP
jgi:hypothetical protein